MNENSKDNEFVHKAWGISVVIIVTLHMYQLHFKLNLHLEPLYSYSPFSSYLHNQHNLQATCYILESLYIGFDLSVVISSLF